MVSGFLISPYDQDRIFSGDAIEIRIWSKTWAGVVGLNRFIISWFIVFSSRADRHRQQIRNSFSASHPAQRPSGVRMPGQSAKMRFAFLAGQTLFSLLCRLGGRAADLGIVQVDVEAERAHFLDQ